MSTLTLVHRVFTSLLLSVGCGLLFIPWGHHFFRSLNAPGFTVLPPHTSLRIGLVGGALITPLFFPLRPTGFNTVHFLIFLPHAFFIAVFLGATQGLVGSTLWKDRVFEEIDGQIVPGVLGVWSAIIAGGLGGWLAFGLMTLVLIVRYFLFEYILGKEDPYCAGGCGFSIQFRAPATVEKNRP